MKSHTERSSKLWDVDFVQSGIVQRVGVHTVSHIEYV